MISHLDPGAIATLRHGLALHRRGRSPTMDPYAKAGLFDSVVIGPYKKVFPEN